MTMAGRNQIVKSNLSLPMLNEKKQNDCQHLLRNLERVEELKVNWNKEYQDYLEDKGGDPLSREDRSYLDHQRDQFYGRLREAHGEFRALICDFVEDQFLYRIGGQSIFEFASVSSGWADTLTVLRSDEFRSPKNHRLDYEDLIRALRAFSNVTPGRAGSVCEARKLLFKFFNETLTLEVNWMFLDLDQYSLSRNITSLRQKLEARSVYQVDNPWVGVHWNTS